MKAVIVGGGIGGLTAAIAFAARGWQAELVEQSPALTEVGAGLQISPNGMKVLSALGLSPAVQAAAVAPEALEMRHGRSGAVIFRVPLGPAAEARWGGPYLHLHRADLIAALAAAAEARGVAMRLGTRVTGYAHAGAEAAALHAGGAIAGDVVIAADGLHSRLRTQMLGPEAPRFTGYMAWRAVAPLAALGAAAPPATACVWVGRGQHAVTYRIAGGARVNFVGVVARPDWRDESWTVQGRVDEALADFAGWDPRLTRTIAAAPAHYRWALFDRAPLRRWSDRRVALLGDACHPSLPFLAQGAVMAIEDAFVLARDCAAGADDLPGALARYAAVRLPPTAAVQRRSAANAALFHGRGLHRFAPLPLWLAGRVAPGWLRARFDRFYRADVTAGGG